MAVSRKGKKHSKNNRRWKLVFWSILLVGIFAASSVVQLAWDADMAMDGPSVALVIASEEPTPKRTGEDLFAILSAVVRDDPFIRNRLLIYRDSTPMLIENLRENIVVLISHGSSDGVATSNGVMTWAQMGELAQKSTADALIICTCQSEGILNYSGQSPVIAFGGIIDADVAILAVHYIVSVLLQMEDEAAVAFARLKDPSIRALVDEPIHPLGIVYGVHSFNLNGYSGAIMYKRLTPYSYTSYYCSGTGTVSSWPGIPILNTGIAIHSHGSDYVYWVLDFGGLNYFGRIHSDAYLEEMVAIYIVISIIATVLTYIPVALAAHAAITLALGFVSVVGAILRALLPSIVVYIITLLNEAIFAANPEGLAACLLLGLFDVFALSLGPTLAAFVSLYAGLSGISL